MIGIFFFFRRKKTVARQCPDYNVYRLETVRNCDLMLSAGFPSAGSIVESRDDVNIYRHAGLFLGLDMALESEGLESF
jgi:hypothetical protein